MAKFRTRARAVDMLGRQQIAGVPTAVGELFKNAHDAYAADVEIDLFRGRDLFVLRDNGTGMTEEDFLDRWLVIGTESKLGSDRMARPAIPPGMKPRPTLGEKGIGRLAIAVIGPQVLVLSRAMGRDESQPLIACFVHWGLFEIPGLNLDEVEIPVTLIRDGRLPEAEEVQELVSKFAENLSATGAHLPSARVSQIQSQLEGFKVNPAKLQSGLPSEGELSLEGEGHGTHFFIQPVLDSVLASMEQDPHLDTAPPLTRSLVGFSNTMTPGRPAELLLQTAFRDHRELDDFEDVVAEQEFFTPEEFSNADHQFVGRFDELGKFVGTISVFGEETEYVIPWTSGKGRAPRCGEFDLELAYIQGHSAESTLPDRDWTHINEKLKKIGGLYIYRDGIRVLPYGDPEFDFLKIEERRSKGAAHYFFSYRRMFGAVILTNERNGALKEKAGREGFVSNAPYRDFESLLQNFLIQVAADFFRKGGKEASRYTQVREELKRRNKAAKARRKEAARRQQEFAQALDRYFGDVESDAIRREIEKILGSVQAKLDKAKASGGIDGDFLIQEEIEARRRLWAMWDHYKIDLPQDVGVPPDLQRRYEDYRYSFAQLSEKLLHPGLAEIEGLFRDAADDGAIPVSVGDLLKEGVSAVAAAARDGVGKEGTVVKDLAGTIKADGVEFTEGVLRDLDEVLKEVVDATSDTTSVDEGNLGERLQSAEAEIREASEEASQQLERLRVQLKAISFSRGRNGDEPGPVEALAALESDLYAIEQQALQDLEMAQLGAAVGIIGHEFGNSIKAVRRGLRRLKVWVDENPQLRPAYEDVLNSFEHLDAYLKLFTPLQRRLYRSKTTFTGSRILRFLKRVFQDRLEEEDVALIASDEFMKRSFTGFPSNFYPAFMNLVDNSLYWLQNRSADRRILLDVDGDSVLVRDTGPGVNARDRDRIFAAGFSRKPAGRGMGLKISRDALAYEGYDLTLAADDEGGAVFRIAPSLDEG